MPREKGGEGEKQINEFRSYESKSNGRFHTKSMIFNACTQTWSRNRTESKCREFYSTYSFEFVPKPFAFNHLSMSTSLLLLYNVALIVFMHSVYTKFFDMHQIDVGIR